MRVDIGGGVRLFVDVDGAKLVPDGPVLAERPTVVLLHGGPGMDHALFKGPTYDFTDLAQVVYYDHRGNGRSDHGDPATDWTLDVWADDVVRLCDALGIVQPIVVGESFGGFVAQRYLARHPDHPSRVALLCTAPRIDVDLVAARFEQLGGEQAGAAARAFWTKGPEAILDYLTHCMPLYDVDPTDPDQLGRIVMNLDVLDRFLAHEQLTMDERAGLAATTCPVFVAGGELDPVCPIEMSEEIVAALVNAEVTYERCADASHGDVGRRAADALRAFIAGSG